MKQEILVEEPPSKAEVSPTFGDMKIGQYARILPKESTGQRYAGEIVLRTWSGWVSITDPNHTWYSGQPPPQLAVYIYPSGTKFTATQPDANQ